MKNKSLMKSKDWYATPWPWFSSTCRFVGSVSIFRVLHFLTLKKGSELFQRPASYTRRQNSYENRISLFHVIFNSLFTSRSLFDVLWYKTFESVFKYTKKESVCQLDDLEAILCWGLECCLLWAVEDRVFCRSVTNVSYSSKFTDFTQPTETRAAKIQTQELRLMAFHKPP